MFTQIKEKLEMEEYKLNTGEHILIPNHINDVDLSLYIKIQELINNNVDTDIDFSLKLISLYTGINTDDISIYDFNNIIYIINKIEFSNLSSYKERITIDGIEYKLKKNLDELTFGEVYTIKQTMIGNNQSTLIPLLISILYTTYQIKYDDEFRIDRIVFDEFDINKLPDRINRFQSIPVNDVYGVVYMFLEWETNIINRFDTLYKRKPIDNTPTLETIKINPHWSMVAMLDALTNQDITKNEQVFNINYIECLTILTSRAIQDEYYRKVNKNN